LIACATEPGKRMMRYGAAAGRQLDDLAERPRPG